MVTTTITNQANAAGWNPGATNDTLTVNNSTITSIGVFAGAGNDNVYLYGPSSTAPNGATNINFANAAAGNSVAMGSGNDNLLIDGKVNILGGIALDLGDDTTAINTTGTLGTNLGGYSLDSGDGNDTLTLKAGTFSGNVTGGVGTDIINISGGTYKTVLGGTGSDAVTVSNFTGLLTINGEEDANLLDVDTLDLSAFAPILESYVISSTNPESGTVKLTDGRIVNYSNIEKVTGIAPKPAPVCFVRGMRLETKRGEVCVEDLGIGDLVRTYDHGYQPIRLIYKRKMAGEGMGAPVFFEKHSIGNQEPLIVSQKHRFFTGALPEHVLPRFIGHQFDHLIHADALINGRTIRILHGLKEVEYYHIMLDAHELVYSFGTISESWHPLKRNLHRDQVTRRELLQFFPQIKQNTQKTTPLVRTMAAWAPVELR